MHCRSGFRFGLRGGRREPRAKPGLRLGGPAPTAPRPNAVYRASGSPRSERVRNSRSTRHPKEQTCRKRLAPAKKRAENMAEKPDLSHTSGKIGDPNATPGSP